MKKIFLTILLTAFCFSGFAQKTDKKTTIKVLSFNILHGATTLGDFNLDAIAKVIIDTDPDLVALQEVDFKTRRAHQYDLATELGWCTKMAPLFGRAMYFDGGEYGEGILSKFSFISSENIPLPYEEGKEPRAALKITTVLSSNDTISFIATHLDHEKEGTSRQLQAEKLVEIAKKQKYPSILAGDLNDTPGSKTINILEQEWAPSYGKMNPEPTYPSDNPRLKIDYVMVNRLGQWRVIETKVIADTIASDHCAYLVTLELVKE